MTKPLDDIWASMTDRQCKLLELVNDGRLTIRTINGRDSQVFIWDAEMRGGQQATQEEKLLICALQDRMLVTRPPFDGKVYKATLTAWGRAIHRQWTDAPRQPLADDADTVGPLAEAVTNARRCTRQARDTLARTSMRLTDSERYTLAALRVALVALDEAYQGLRGQSC